MKYQTLMKPFRGVTLVELMVALAIGLLVVLGVAVVFSRNSATRNEIERSTRQLGNGHYASKLLSSDIRLAGFLSSYSSFSAPTALPSDPCSTALTDLQSDFKVFLQGYDNALPSGVLACVSDYKAGTDIIVVRRASTCAAANFPGTGIEPGCSAVASGVPYVQASGCITDTVPFKLDTNSANLNLRKIGCANTATLHRMYTNIYYVANNNLAGDGIPTLKRWELGGGVNPVALVEGIENVQYEYGLDTNNDGSPDSYTSAPADIAAWTNVVTVKIHLLARNETESPGYTDNKFYMLGGTRVPASGTFGDAFRRHVYSTTVMVENPAGRRQ